ncbi:MAG TPA: NUDIX hydrolase [Gemmatimonadaceae bacterium]|nr:NUDIX hydrolase [Gemmatimonadaceae bacterium]
MTDLPRDNDAYRFPVSVKGVVLRDHRVVLVKNRREEWELPGGKLELGEDPSRCVAREIEEELQLAVAADQLIDAWVYTIAEGTHVLVVSYGCTETLQRRAVLSDEHTELEWIALADIDGLRMPDGYKRSIRRWAERGESR